MSLSHRKSELVSFDGPLPVCVSCGGLCQWRADPLTPLQGMWWCKLCGSPAMGPLPLKRGSKGTTDFSAHIAGPLPEGWQ